jgi:hypothetical protein
MQAPFEDDGSDVEFRDHLRPWLILGAVLIGLTLGVYYGGRPAYTAYKEQKALRQVAFVEAALKAGKPETAAPELRMALALAPGLPAVWRVAGQFCAMVGSEDGLSYWERLAGSSECSDQDRLEYAEYAHRMGRVDVVARQLELLVKSPGLEPRFWRLAVEHLRGRDEPERAAEAARQWHAMEPTSEETQFALGATLLSHPDKRLQGEGRGLLWGLALGKGPWARSAVSEFLSFGDLDRGELETLYRSGERLGAKPTVLAGLKLRISPDQRERVLGELIQASSGTNIALRREAVAFLADRNELVKALDLMPTNLVATDVRLRSARLQALLDLERTEQAAAEMSDAGELLAVEPHLRFCLEAQVAVKADRRDQAARLLQQAVVRSGREPGPLRFCAIYAERLGFPKESIAAYQKLAEHPPATIMACRQVLRLAMASDNLAEGQLALRRASRFLPDDPAFLVGSVYLDLLMGQRSGQERLSSVEEVLAKRPRDAFTRATVALGRWRAGNLTGAVALLEEGDVDWDKAEPRCRAVRAAILGANLQREAARQIVRSLDVERLMSAERMLVEEWR